jgi:hypothetical protein
VRYASGHRCVRSAASRSKLFQVDTRLGSLDLIRGVGIIAVVFLHSATFHYESITEIDFDNPPLVITVIGFLLMWAGLFALVSSVAYTYSSVTRLKNGEGTPGQLLKGFWCPERADLGDHCPCLGAVRLSLFDGVVERTDL